MRDHIGFVGKAETRHSQGWLLEIGL